MIKVRRPRNNKAIAMPAFIYISNAEIDNVSLYLAGYPLIGADLIESIVVKLLRRDSTVQNQMPPDRIDHRWRTSYVVFKIFAIVTKPLCQIFVDKSRCAHPLRLGF